MMATAFDQQVPCRYGSNCKRPNCIYLHPQRDFMLWYNLRSQASTFDNLQQSNNSYEQNVYDSDRQHAVLRQSSCQYSMNQSLSNTTILQSQISTFSDDHSELYQSDLYANLQQDSTYDNQHWHKRSSNRSQTSNESSSHKSLDSNFRSSQRNKYNFSRNTSFTLPERLKTEIQILLNEKVPEVSAKHQLLIDEQIALLDENDEMKFVDETNLQELKDQLQTFEQTTSELSMTYPSTTNHAQHLLHKLKREIERFKARLPIYARRQQLIDTITSNRVTILKGETGSGKSTQLVQYLVDAGFASYGEIVCTQPRRLAVRELASRVAKEFGCEVGEQVGCQVGVSCPQISPKTKIRFATDAALLNEYQKDPMLATYALVIIDEAHERRVDTDLLFGAMKLCLKQRSDMKLVIMSATLDDKLLKRYYGEACLIEIPGRIYPIEDVYALEDAENHVDEAINKTLEIHASQLPGDILVFLTGQDEIDRAIDEVTKKIDPPESAIVLPLHGKLNEDEMKAAFTRTRNDKRRKIIFSTNVAETSVTIDGIRYVIDTGMVKEVMWDSKRQMRILKLGYTTQSSIKQRRGRAGRTSPGKCYHLYTYDTYQSLDVCSRAEILCIQPSTAVLKLKHLDIVDDITKFDWLEPPSDKSLAETVKCLTWLGALDSETGKLTTLGRRVARLGLEPMLSVMIFTGEKLYCISYILALAGMLNVVQNLWWHSKDDQSKQLGDEIRSSFVRDTNIGGDYIVLLRIFLEWYALRDSKQRQKVWCLKHMISWKAMKMANNFVREIAYQIQPKLQIQFSQLNEGLIKRIVQCIYAGFFQNLAISNGPIRAGYQLAVGTTDTVARIHRSSTVPFTEQLPKFILYHEILNINEKNYLTVICPVELDSLDQSWLNSLPHSPSQYVFESYAFLNLGPALLFSLVGKKSRKIAQLEEQLHILFEIDRVQSKLTIWGRKDKLLHAQEYLQEILNREREKLRNELQEFEIVGSTRILLGAGAEPRLVLVDDEYVKIFLSNLPKNITEEQIQDKCQVYGEVRNVTKIRTNYNSSSASVTYVECKSAQTAVTGLSHVKWDEYGIYVRPSYTRTTIDTRKQSYTLKAQWFLTRSECNGRIVFSKMQTAQRAYQLFTQRHHFYCQFEINLVNPTIKCFWPITPHHGHAIVHFQTVELAQEALEAEYDHPFRLEHSRRSNTSIYVRNIPRDLDEINLKAFFAGCTDITILRARKITSVATPIGVDATVRELFHDHSSFQPQSICIEPVLHDGHVVAYVQFTDEREMRAVFDEMDRLTIPLGSGKLRVKIQEQRQIKASTKRNEMKKDEFRIKLSKLPAHIDEKFLIQQLYNKGIHDSMTYAFVFREKLPADYFSSRTRTIAEENDKALATLKSLFADRKQFRSEPEIEIRSPTEDGRVTAFIRFNDPREIITAINICDSFHDIAIQDTGLDHLHFTPLLSHRIVLHEILAQAINKKIEQTINNIKENSEYSDVIVFKKPITIDDKPNVLISIRGTNIQQLYQVRILFNELLKGLQFHLFDHLWVNVLFDPAGQKFLHALQSRTRTYIWWNWKSTFLRIFGEDQACQDAYKEIETFIKETLAQREHSISISIPKDCIRQCIQNSYLIKEMNNSKTKIVLNMIKHLIVINGDRETLSECERKVKELLDKFASLSNHSNGEKTTDMNNICSICSCEFDGPYALQQCGHTFCHSCLTAYFDTYFDVTRSFEAFKLSCPLQQCNEVCLIRDIVSVLGFERMARLAMIAFQIYLRRHDNNLIQCIGIDCKQVYRPSEHSSMYFCDQCIKVYCTSCEVEYHTGMTCEQYKKLHEEKNEDAILEYNLGKLTHKPCPKCRAPIDKYAGCNAVKCTLCNIQFCWRCRAIDEEDIHRHFTNPESSCYNRMLDENMGGNEYEQNDFFFP